MKPPQRPPTLRRIMKVTGFSRKQAKAMLEAGRIWWDKYGNVHFHENDRAPF